MMGSQMIWWVGVVEDRNDPLKLGRLRVRILGWHTADKVAIPTSKLPWAYPIVPITSAAISGIGVSPTGAVEGTWVVGFFRDGANGQEPILLGAIPGDPGAEEPNYAEGFSDPNKNYPRYNKNTIIGKDTLTSDIHPSATEDANHSPVFFQKDTRITKVGGETVGELPAEPTPPYAGKYPYVHTTESESGHIRHMDDTPGAERIFEMHRSGTFYEIDKSGNKVTKIFGKDWYIILDDSNMIVGGDQNITVAGNCNMIVKGNMTTTIDGDFDQVVNGKYQLRVDGTIVEFSNGNRYIDAPEIHHNDPNSDPGERTIPDPVIQPQPEEQLGKKNTGNTYTRAWMKADGATFGNNNNG